MSIKPHELVFEVALYASYILYFIAYFQIDYYNPQYLETLEGVMKYYVIAFLIIRFNPFIHTKLTEFDRKVVFSSALFLLATTTFSEYAKQFDFTEIAKILRFIR